MRMPSASRDPERNALRASDLVRRLAVLMGVASAMTLAAMALVGIDSGWALVAAGEALVSLALFSQV
jgi:hypothetical protein